MVTKRQTQQMTAAEMFARAKELIGDPKLALERQEQSKQNHLFLQSHMDEGRKLYPDQLVAVRDQEFVAVAKSRDELIERLGRQGIGAGEVFIGFVPAQKFILVV